MVKVTSFESQFYHPPAWEGLQELVRFPDGEFKKTGIPNSTIWVFDKKDHEFQAQIHGGDIGCGMVALNIEKVDEKEAADQIYDFLHKKNVIGRGNHFVDICSSFQWYYDDDKRDNNVLLVHTHGNDNTIPTSIEKAIRRQENNSEYRVETAFSLANLIGVKSSLITDWCHNTIEKTNENFIYRKGVVKMQPVHLGILPAHIGLPICLYGIGQTNSLPYSSMPHATGRAGPRGKMKVTKNKAKELRDLCYIPEGMADTSLRTEHPNCYNDYTKIFDELSPKGFQPVGEMEVLAYIGKV